MGKFQLDYKGMQQVERFHEKHSTVKDDKKARVQALLKQAKKKAGKKVWWSKATDGIEKTKLGW